MLLSASPLPYEELTLEAASGDGKLSIGNLNEEIQNLLGHCTCPLCLFESVLAQL